MALQSQRKRPPLGTSHPANAIKDTHEQLSRKGARLLTLECSSTTWPLPQSITKTPPKTCHISSQSHDKTKGNPTPLNPSPRVSQFAVIPHPSHVRLPNPSPYLALNQGIQFTVRRPFHPSNEDAGNTHRRVKNESSPGSHAQRVLGVSSKCTYQLASHWHFWRKISTVLACEAEGIDARHVAVSIGRLIFTFACDSHLTAN
ncbi:hypothetical protein B0J14DRAFT_241096 [Halenospora varia]|nr:hypothetical protein B0J14DRAFT_241096 [Halenospora varia]